MGYTYAVSGQWQGEFQELRVIGDKIGGDTIRRLDSKPELLERLADTIQVPVKFVHVVRNPYDNIATMAGRPRHSSPNGVRREVGIPKAIERYFRLCAKVADFSARVAPDRIFSQRHEAFIDSPRTRLEELCCFLGVEARADYLSACAGIVHPTPRKSRHNVEWTPDQIAHVAAQIEKYPFLHGYSFDD